ncbi:MAG: Peptidase sortase-like protein [Parcubacteria group bacterium]|nr:Peptidase sortase-like protein [Parcubacteria group bacterium]
MSATPHTAQNKGIIGPRKWIFLVLAFVVFGGTVMALSSFDLLPDSSLSGATAPTLTESQKQAEVASTQVLPEKIEIPKLKLVATVANPTTTNATILDKDLLYGAVRYPSSGTLGAAGQNVVLFGHSSYLPVVHNQAYKTFDGIQTLAHGDQILVTGAGKTYVYEVETVAQANTQNAGIPLTVDGNKLTLVTCDSFATKSDRYVVIAHLVESYPSAS